MSPLRAFESEPLRGSHLANRLWLAAQRRRSVLTHTNAVRLHDVDADDVCCATIECFDDWMVLNAYDARACEPAVAAALMELGAKGVYLKRRVRVDPRRTARADVSPDVPAVGALAPALLSVTEYGMRFGVRLDDGLSTGLFLDQRSNRAVLRAEAAGARVLNLFCYTGAFSVAAAAGGAALTTSVDLSASALGRLSANVALNAQAADLHRVLRADAVKWLARAVRRCDEFDRIVLDPPSFASVGRGTFSVAKDYAGMIGNCLRLLPPGGRVLAVTNHRKTQYSEFEAILREAAAAAARSVALSRGELPADCAPAHDEPATKSVWITRI